MPTAQTAATAVAVTVAEVRVRRLGTAVVCAAMMAIFSGCGRQVTGLNSPNGGIVPPGQTLVRFETAGALDFSNLSYLIVFNTQGTNREPYALGNNSNFVDWSFAIQVGGTNPGFSGGTAFVGTPILYQIFQNPQNAGSGFQTFQPPFPPQFVSFRPTVPTSVAQNGFEIQFNRCILDQPNPTLNPRPTPNPSTVCPPFSFINSLWNINLFTVDRNGNVVDSLGPNGAQDTTVKFTVDVTRTISDQTLFKTANGTVGNLSAQITGIEVFNTP